MSVFKTSYLKDKALKTFGTLPIFLSECHDPSS